MIHAARRAAFGCTLAALLGLPTPARAERGRVIAELAGGAAMVGADLPQPGGARAGAVGSGAWERVSVVLGSQLVLHRSFDTLGLGGGVKVSLFQGEWSRLYVLLEPQVLLERPRGPRVDTAWRADLAGFGGVGWQYLLLWGLGFAVELDGALPLGLDAPSTSWRLAEASLQLVAGLYMEL